MQTINENKTPDGSLNNQFDALCQEFDGRRFYGLEYILEDFFECSIVKPTVHDSPAIDWFGLYN